MRLFAPLTWTSWRARSDVVGAKAAAGAIDGSAMRDLVAGVAEGGAGHRLNGWAKAGKCGDGRA